MASTTQHSVPHDFTHEELVRALTEQEFGITSYEIVSSSPLKATARVELLEGETILVSLTSRGYQLQSLTELPTDPDLDAEFVFETIEQFLQSVSPQYEAARRTEIMAKLDALSPDDA